MNELGQKRKEGRGRTREKEKWGDNNVLRVTTASTAFFLILIQRVLSPPHKHGPKNMIIIDIINSEESEKKTEKGISQAGKRRMLSQPNNHVHPHPPAATAAVQRGRRTAEKNARPPCGSELVLQYVPFDVGLVLQVVVQLGNGFNLREV